MTRTWIIFFSPKICLDVHILVNTEHFFMLQTKLMQATPSFYLRKPGASINERSLPRTLNLKIGTQRHRTLEEQEFMVLVVNTTYWRVNVYTVQWWDIRGSILDWLLVAWQQSLLLHSSSSFPAGTGCLLVLLKLVRVVFFCLQPKPLTDSSITSIPFFNVIH